MFLLCALSLRGLGRRLLPGKLNKEMNKEFKEIQEINNKYKELLLLLNHSWFVACSRLLLAGPPSLASWDGAP